MITEEYLSALRKELQGLSEKDIRESVDFYKEMIADRMEDGISEEDAIAGMPSPADAAKEILLDKPRPQAALAQGTAKGTKEKHLPSWAMVLLILGAVVWFPLLIAAGSVVLAVDITLIALIIAAFSISIALVGSFFFADFYAIYFFIHGKIAVGIFYFGLSMLSVGAAILSFFFFGWFARKIFSLIKLFGRWVKSLFIRKKEA